MKFHGQILRCLLKFFYNGFTIRFAIIPAGGKLIRSFRGREYNWRRFNVFAAVRTHPNYWHHRNFDYVNYTFGVALTPLFGRLYYKFSRKINVIYNHYTIVAQRMVFCN